VTDPDGNRIRIAQPSGPVEVDTFLGIGAEAELRALETAMWDIGTRGDATWFADHLSPDFTEHGRSGRTYDRAQILAVPVDTIDVALPLADVVVRPVGRDTALITYRSVQPGGTAHRSSVWQRLDGEWRLSFHQGTPVD
jgi:ribonuclease HI